MSARAATTPEPWHRAEEEGNPQGYTYAARPGGPFAYTRSQFSRAVRAACAEQAAGDRLYRTGKRYPRDLETFRGMH